MEFLVLSFGQQLHFPLLAGPRPSWLEAPAVGLLYFSGEVTFSCIAICKVIHGGLRHGGVPDRDCRDVRVNPNGGIERYQPQRPKYLEPSALLSEDTVDPYVPLR
eukprot:1160205-Pelagomonas_calceolata.AAC.9